MLVPSPPSSGWFAPGQQPSLLLCCANKLVNQVTDPTWFANTHTEQKSRWGAAPSVWLEQQCCMEGCGEPSPPQLGLVSPFSWSEERDPVKTRLCMGRGQGWRQTALLQPPIAWGDGSRKAKTLSGGSVPSGRGTHFSSTKKLGQGRREWWGRWARAWTAGEPARVCNWTCVFMAEPTWRWKWIFHRTRFRNTQTVSSYTSTAQSKSWGDSFSFRTSWIL